MAVYSKTSGNKGPWLDKASIRPGTKVKIMTEAVPVEEPFQGKMTTRNIVKLRVQGDETEPKNFDINKPSINALIDAFGEDSKAWIGKALTAETMRVIVGGKMGTAMYLIPEGYEFGTDDAGYAVVKKIGEEKAPVASADAGVVYPEDDINPEDIPF